MYNNEKEIRKQQAIRDIKETLCDPNSSFEERTYVGHYKFRNDFMVVQKLIEKNQHYLKKAYENSHGQKKASHGSWKRERSLGRSGKEEEIEARMKKEIRDLNWETYKRARAHIDSTY